MKNACHRTAYIEFAKWAGTSAGVVGAILIALNIGVVAYGFGFFLLSALFWAWVGWVQRETSLVILQGAFLIIDAMGLYRWFEF
ncbi:MAG: hypothetical protein JJ855_04400 [Rhodospirillales bacterium]|nr:hypothetical protein [Rhodospirillales bacterium]